jgi:hypothetical protein
LSSLFHWEEQEFSTNTHILERPQGVHRCLLRCGEAPDARDIESLVGSISPQRLELLATLEIPEHNGSIIPAARQSAAIRTHLERLVTINTLPSEVSNPIRCDIDEVHSSYDPVHAQRFWRIMVQTDAVLRRYRSPFLGKSSPIHFFWGSFDLAYLLLLPDASHTISSV